jgi:tRNA 2-thiouridine synthesizing protein E
MEYAGAAVEINDEGFLIESDSWTREIAEAIAQEVGIGPLTDKHWQVIEFCRNDATEQGQPPGLRRISKLSGINMKELYQLFPKGPGKLAARVSGLPKPQGCI